VISYQARSEWRGRKERTNAQVSLLQEPVVWLMLGDRPSFSELWLGRPWAYLASQRFHMNPEA
jgi:hypothetical protein